MHSLVSLSSDGLIEKTKSLIQEEREITVRLLKCLLEIERRALFSEHGYGSLFEFTVKHLGLSEGAAHRRISAMRLVRDLPEAEEELVSGGLSLSSATRVQALFQMERRSGKARSMEGKRQVLNAVRGLSRLECDRKLQELAPDVLPQGTELRLMVSESFRAKLDELRGLIAHRFPGITPEELMEKLLDEELVRERSKQYGKPLSTGAPAPERTASCPANSAAGQIKTLHSGVRIPLPRALKRQVWRNAGGQCEFWAAGGRRCSSRYALQIDHIRPLALGGENELENLRLLCAAHNRYEAMRALWGVGA